MVDPDSIDQTVEALKMFDSQKDGKLDVNELRYYLCQKGNPMDPAEVDELIKELDKEKTGVIDIMALTEVTHEKDKGVEKKKKDGGGAGKKGKK